MFLIIIYTFLNMWFREKKNCNKDFSIFVYYSISELIYFITHIAYRLPMCIFIGDETVVQERGWNSKNSECDGSRLSVFSDNCREI